MPRTAQNRSILPDKPGHVTLPILLQLLLISSAFAGTTRAPIPNALRIAVEAQQHSLQPDGIGYRGENAEQHFALRFNRQHASVLTGGSDIRISLVAYGRESNWNGAQSALMSAQGNRVDYRRGDVTEWYVNKPDGLEQGFTLSTRPQGSGALQLKLLVNGGATAKSETPDSVMLRTKREMALRYSGLKAWDAAGRQLEASMRADETEIRLAVDDTGAAYPITIDPIVQQAKLTPPDALAGDDFGYSVAISGTTALVGAFGKADFTGAAYVYVQNGTTWTQQAKLTAPDGASFNNFGENLALSGNTAIIGAFENSGSVGAAYVFVRNGTAWAEQAKLQASNGKASDEFGFSVSIDGNTALIGALDAGSLTGTAYVFTRTGTAWTQQAELTASDGASFDAFGVSVSVSGTLALVGARSHASNGAAYVFVQSGTTWTQQAKLTASDGAAFDDFGSAVSLNGTTALIGAYNNKSSLGAAYVFVQSGTTWPLQAKLTTVGGASGDEFGYSVAINGNAALIGAPFQGRGTGSAYLFVRSGAVWAEQAKLNASDASALDEFGTAVSFSGNAGIVGAPFKVESMGAAYVYATPLTAPSPASGHAGATITVSGSGFSPNEVVYIFWNVPRSYLAHGVADATGSFSGVSVTVPAAAALGVNSFYVQGATAKDLGTGYFTVQ